MKRWAKNLLLFGLVAVGSALVLSLAAWAVRPDLRPRPFPYTPEQIAAAESARAMQFDPQHTPTLYRHEHVAPAGEAPILAGLVRDGELPPLSQRMPAEPAVIQGLDGVGVYGGTWLRIANQPSDVEYVRDRFSGAALARWSPLGYPIEPHIARSIEPANDMREWTITLREGMRWSDGHPFTTDDVMYWWECEANNKLVMPALPPWLISNGKFGRLERVDAYRFKIIFEDPCPTLPARLITSDSRFNGAVEMCNTPAHYLRPLHPDPAIGDEATCAEMMRIYRQPSRRALYFFMKHPLNPEHPRLWPWVYRTYRSTAPYVFVRNPYYFAVDSAGNQLPYLDRMQFEVQDPKILAQTAANGGVSVQDRHIRFADYTELMSRREAAGTEIYHWYPAIRSIWAINPNLNRRIDPEDPSTKFKAALLSDKRFRQALSLAIDRRQIIDAEYNGVGEPSQVAPGPRSPFAHDGVAKAFTEHDPAHANALLDELGLTKRDHEGYRTFPDGSRMTFYLDYTSFTGLGPGQFVVDDWAEVGVRCIYRERNRPLFYAAKDGMDFDFNIWTSESDFMPVLEPRYFIAKATESFYAVGWGKWFMRGGLYDMPQSRGNGAIPVPKDHPMYEAMLAYEKALVTTDVEAQKRWMDRVMDIAAENTWTISIATAPPTLVVVKNGMKNVPKLALHASLFWTPVNAGLETFYNEHPVDSPGAIAETRAALLHVTPRPGASSGGDSSAAGGVIRWGLLAVVLLCLVLIGLRHPFIMRRLLIMIPTLLIVSVAVFTIIQLPPGDFLTARIIQLQESGDAVDMSAIDDLRRMYHFDEPMWKQYVRWMGFNWFLGFNPRDAGLLQGNLGRSMETNTPVNNLVGDTILLTVLISLGTILFTWLIALPIGVYSAVRQYSWSDYALTLMGFIGMCIPAFLLALVLMAASGVSGLFSARYATQPEWDWGKVIDLLRHLWVPIIVLGIGGTAGMIRIMRANLLDELKKPYVTTAMAKGVRPLKLLIKYPLRMALNPFVSGLGALFPQLVSGGAIVAVVLALPTVGPMLLAALLNEDMYLAGSMLMVLSILGVLGTLVSDLLLLWLDPRIRFEGGSR
jgi:ABC-type dipeptide/oligopeptide/nickel transport system permease component/ABC-type transport system substrate-binding protein